MTDTNAASNTSAAPSSHTANDNDNHRAPNEQPTTPSAPQFEWTNAKDGVLVSLMAANSSYTHFPRWTQFAMACKNFGLGVPYHLSDDDLLNRCHELKSTLEEWDLVVNARKRPKDEMGYLAYLKGYRSDDPIAQVGEGGRSAAEAEEDANGTSEDAANQGGRAAVADHQTPQDTTEQVEQSGGSNASTQHKHKNQRQSIVRKIEAKKRARKRQSSIVIQGKFDFFNVKKTARGSKKTVSFRGEGTVNVPF